MAYEFYLTDKGTELLGQLTAGEKVAITKVCFGSGATSKDRHDYRITELKHLETEKTLNPNTDSAFLDPNDNSIVCLTSELPRDFTGTINEIGYKDSNDNLVLYGNIPEEVVSSHPNKTYQYKNWVAFENQEVEKIEFGVMSPDFQRVEELVKKIENEFEPTEFARKEDVEKNTKSIETLKTQVAGVSDLESRVTELEKLPDRVTALEGLVDRVEKLETTLSGVEEMVSSINTRLEAIV